MIRTSDKKPNLKNLQYVASQLKKHNGLPGKETGLMMNKGNKQRNLAAIHQLDIRPNDCILEIGMGNGFFVKDILSDDKTIRYCGCDFSQTMIKEAMSLNKRYIHDGQAAFINENASRMPFDDETFNKIFTVNTINFWEEIEPVFSEIRRLLKKDDLLVLSFRPK